MAIGLWLRIHQHTHLILPQCDVTKRQTSTNKGSCICLHYIGSSVAHAHAQNMPLKWFLSTPGLGVVPRLSREICLFNVAYSGINICEGHVETSLND